MMRKKMFLALLLAVCVALSGCALVVKDAGRDAAQVIVDVNGEQVTKGEMQEPIADATYQIQLQAYNDYYQNYINQYYNYMIQYGIEIPFNFDINSVDVSGAKQLAIDNEVERLVLEQKFAALGMTLDDADVQAHAQEDYDNLISQIKDMLRDQDAQAAAETTVEPAEDGEAAEEAAAAPEAEAAAAETEAEPAAEAAAEPAEAPAEETAEAPAEEVAEAAAEETAEDDAELTARAEAYRVANYPEQTMEYYTVHARQELMREQLREYAIKDVAVTDDDVKAEFDSRVESAKTSYESNLSSFGSAVNNGQTVYYRPAGYRYVKQILVGFSDAAQEAISAANSELSTARSALTTATNNLQDNTDALAAEGITDEEKAELEGKTAELQAAVDAAQADLDAKQAAYDAAIESAKAEVKPTLDEVTAKIAAGEDFDALIDQYNTDPGMQNEPTKTTGYAVCEGFTVFESSFVEAAMALEKIGDVSDPVLSNNYGYFIIRYQADIEEGAVELTDEIRAIMEPDILSQKQNDTYASTVQQWKDEASIKTYLDRLNN